MSHIVDIFYDVWLSLHPISKYSLKFKFSLTFSFSVALLMYSICRHSLSSPPPHGLRPAPRLRHPTLKGRWIPSASLLLDPPPPLPLTHKLQYTASSQSPPARCPINISRSLLFIMSFSAAETPARCSINFSSSLLIILSFSAAQTPARCSINIRSSLLIIFSFSV